MSSLKMEIDRLGLLCVVWYWCMFHKCGPEHALLARLTAVLGNIFVTFLLNIMSVTYIFPGFSERALKVIFSVISFLFQ